jgi:UDP-glucose 4-epimerase
LVLEGRPCPRTCQRSEGYAYPLHDGDLVSILVVGGAGLVVGGAGYIGSHTAKALVEAGQSPIVFDNLSSGHRWALRWGAFEEGDLSSPESIAAVFERHQIRSVIQFAALIQVGESVRDPRKYFRGNVVNTLNLLDAMLDARVREIVFSSTAAVHGNPVQVPIPEDHPLSPVSPYGDSKLAVERILLRYGRRTASGPRRSVISTPRAPIRGARLEKRTHKRVI